MNEKETNRIKNLVLIFMGVVVSLAAIVYIVAQYSKLLAVALTKGEALPDDVCANKVKSRFRQIPDKENEITPETLDENDLSVDIPA